MLARTLFTALLAMLGLAIAPVAGAVTLDFEQFGHGEVISDTTVSGVTITAFNSQKPFDWGAVFDTRVSGSKDPDLEAGSPAWRGGNLSEANLGFDPELGNILVVQRIGTGCDSGFCSVPDDQGGGGTRLDFVFDQDVTSIGWDLVDIDSDETAGFITFHSGAAQVMFDFGDLLPAALFGDGSANRFDPILAADVGFASFDRVTIDFGGSGGIDNLTFEPVPEPGTLAMLAAGLLGIATQARRRRS